VFRLLICAVCLLAVGTGVAVAASTGPAQPPAFARRPIPARMLGSDVPMPVSPALLRVRNGWLVSDGRTLVAVYAGAAGNDPSVGRLVIVRQDLVAGEQTVRTLDAGPTGALTIVAASAPAERLSVRTGRGRTLRLDLRTGTLT
jgi:hypothetical protein